MFIVTVFKPITLNMQTSIIFIFNPQSGQKRMNFLNNWANMSRFSTKNTYICPDSKILKYDNRSRNTAVLTLSPSF